MTKTAPRVGDRVRITGLMDDPYPILVGTTGTITRVHEGDGWWQADVAWDNSDRRLMLIEVDPFEVIA